MPSIRTAIALVTLTTLPLWATIDRPVSTENGRLSSVAGNHPDVRVFKGIPFAVPPVGDLRWREPKSAASWSGVRVADTFSANCMQRAAGGGAFPPYGGDRSAGQMSEDCLYLNVYTTAKSFDDKRPVMVWIHGGALTSGAGAIYQGEELARKGVVVVTVNYRLGVFGFLAHPDLTKESEHRASGNYGLLDQIAALKWVKKNVAAFGGDPTRVTIFGESAGSWSVNYLMASPLARGLFHRVIGESGGQFAPGRTLADAEQAGAKFAQSVGATSPAALRAMSADDLAKANGFQTAGNVDGWFLPEEVHAIFTKGRQNDVPLLLGSNADEGSIFTPATVTIASFREQSERRFGPDAPALLKVYSSTSDGEARAAQAALMRDQTFGWEMRTWARIQERTGTSKAYLYYFTRVPPIPDAARAGSQHGAEIPYAFNWVNGAASPTPWQDVDRGLADKVSSYWVNFAATGDPNGKGLPKWPSYQSKDDLAMHLGDSIAVAPVPHKPALDFLDGYIDRLRRATSAKASTTSRNWSPGRTPDGQPDIQGIWTNYDSTPFEAFDPSDKPNLYAGDPEGTSRGTGPASFPVDVTGRKLGARRGSLVVDPPNGRVPVMAWAEQKRDRDLARVADSWEHQTAWERCITRGVPGGIFPASYNSGYRIVQAPGYVVIHYEMIHEARIIPLDGRPHVSEGVKLWNGDSRGHWEGNTLVVDITNYNSKGNIATNIATQRIRALPQSEQLHVVERFTAVDANTINYEVSISDPKVFSAPWKVAIPFSKEQNHEIFEYACHEGNYALPNTLKAGRAKDAEETSRGHK